MIKDLPHQKIGSVRMIDTPIQLSDTPTGAEAAAPTLGQHTLNILADLLGLSTREIAVLNETGAVKVPSDDDYG